MYLWRSAERIFKGTTFCGICFLPRIIACRESSAVLISSSMMTCKRPRSARSLAITCGILTMVLILAGNGARAWAQTADPDDCLSTERILRRYVDALGGQAALSAIDTRTSEAEALEPSFKPGHPDKRRYIFQWKAPDK